jgi:hypothetical protein
VNENVLISSIQPTTKPQTFPKRGLFANSSITDSQDVGVAILDNNKRNSDSNLELSHLVSHIVDENLPDDAKQLIQSELNRFRILAHST